MLLWWNWQTRWFKVPVGDHEGSSPSGSTNWNEAQEQHSDADGQSQDGSLGSLCGRGGMADTLDLGSSAARCKGSSPFARTIFF